MNDKSLYKYERQVSDGKIEVIQTYHLSDGDLQHILAQATRNMLALRRGDVQGKQIILELHALSS